jgi:hypothetical protein
MTVSVKAPTSTTGSIQLNGSDVLTIDSSGNLTAPNNLTVTGTINGDGSGLTGVSAGKILQVVSTTKTDSFTASSASYTDITGLSVAITPSSTSSKIFVMFSLFGNTPNLGYFQLVRGATNISVGDSAGSRVTCTTGGINYGGDSNRGYSYSAHYLDSPSTTSSTTYKVQVRGEFANTVYINRSQNDPDSSTGYRGTSQITVFEVAA